MRHIGRTGLALAAIDLLSAIIVVSYRQPPRPASSLRTEGEYAVTLTWPRKCGADLDLYVRQPDGEIVFFHHKSGSAVHLENDLIPSTGHGYRADLNGERAIVRAVMPGEFVVNVHDYQNTDCVTPIRARVELWRLRGEDARVTRRGLLIDGTGDEQTAFRFSLRPSGAWFGLSRLPRALVFAADAQ